MLLLENLPHISPASWIIANIGYSWAFRKEAYITESAVRGYQQDYALSGNVMPAATFGIQDQLRHVAHSSHFLSLTHEIL